MVLNKPNAGAYTSRNIGYSMAKGEFITIFDGDDWQHPQKIDLLVRGALQQTDGRLVSAPWTRADQDLFFHYRGWRGAYITPPTFPRCSTLPPSGSASATGIL
ncbi:glycosyltransferase family A protein [Pseudarthrobacter sp. So.54]